MITIFSIPKAFTGQFKTIQRNAIKSWKELSAQIVLFGDDKGVSENAKELDVSSFPKIKRNAFGTPLLSDAFKKIANTAKHPILAYVNCDIILLPDFIEAIKKVNLDKFLIVGQRQPLYLSGIASGSRSVTPRGWPDGLPRGERGRRRNIHTKEIVGKKGWRAEIMKVLKKQNSRPVVGGSDYFVFPKTIDFPMPPFAVGRLYWDSWLMYSTRALSIPLINGTKVVTAVHQQHYEGFEEHGYGEVNLGKEAQINLSLLGGRQNCLKIFDADFLLTDRGLVKPKLSFTRIIRRAEIALIVLSEKSEIGRPVLTIVKWCRQIVTQIRQNWNR